MAILGLAEFEAALRRVAFQAGEAARIAVAKTAAEVEAEAKKNFDGAHRRGEPHVGGEKPNVVTGNLRRSIRTDPIKMYALGDYGTVVAPRAIYGRRVELGYPGGGSGPGHQKTRAFPYFVPAAQHGGARLHDHAAEQWRAFLQF